MMNEAYLDIETTGLSPISAQVTVVGLLLVKPTEECFIQFVGESITADSLLSAFNSVEVLYTYNGSRFDLPFLQTKLGINLSKKCSHHDLMYDCWEHKLYGGLKGVEQKLGIKRILSGIDGLESVRLWWRYINNYDEHALKVLCDYNREDVINLKHLKERILSLPADRTEHNSSVKGVCNST
ncbi:MAG: ribonuclease H-like domain-containing protein [Dehalococcoidia bacterium]|nr:ribonuclease H-like domain-containing protein [Dehalococcoidia bacterium]